MDTMTPNPALAGRADGDPRRSHRIWSFLAEGRAQFCDDLVALAATWRNVEIGHELELAVFVAEVWRQVDALLGEHACQIWFALLELGDATPAWRTPSLERELTGAADPRVRAAYMALRDPALTDPAQRWDAGDTDVRRRLGEVLDALQRLARGALIPDLLAPPVPAAPAGPTASVTDLGVPGLRLV